ncbi:hypothetical protein Baya_4845 [Bagarius yarrelli]|uniref:Uncharacterized protein n=1 Tax=Bagarius yarrelli TaxID=175774 RepID=A0A556TRQ7_BAGYA|nr:hypothetical protein Baya_4845 [Bagarius yarrelli]
MLSAHAPPDRHILPGFLARRWIFCPVLSGEQNFEFPPVCDSVSVEMWRKDAVRCKKGREDFPLVSPAQWCRTDDRKI